MSPQLKQQIQNHLNSIGDEQYDEEGLTCLLQQANSLLVDVLTEEEEENFDDPRLTDKQRKELGYE